MPTRGHHRSPPSPGDTLPARARRSPSVEDTTPEPARRPLPLLGDTTRRDVLRLLGAGLAMATASCARAPRTELRPYADAPETRPGELTRYATFRLEDGYATGLLAVCRDGRPIHVEGHPEHPASLGGAGPRELAWVLDLYEGEKIRAPRKKLAPTSFDAAIASLRAGTKRGEGVWLVLPTTSSVAVEDALASLRAAWPEANVVFHAATPRTRAFRATHELFRASREAILDLRRAEVVVSLDSDLLADGPHWLRHARDFASRRVDRNARSRLYAAECGVSITGSNADERLAIRRRDVARLAAALLVSLDASAPVSSRREAILSRAPGREFVDALARDLLARRAHAVVAAGTEQSLDAQVLSLGTQFALGVGDETPVRFVPPSLLDANGAGHDEARLLAALEAGAVSALVVLGCPLLDDLPDPSRWSNALEKARRVVVWSEREDELTALASAVSPLAHPLSSWDAARALDGTLTIAQPTIEPLHGGRSILEVLMRLAGSRETARARVAAAVDARAGHGAFEASVARGFVPGSAHRAEAVSARPDALVKALDRVLADASHDVFEVSSIRDRKLGDGALRHSPWLLELPDPITKLTWRNAAEMSAATAAKLGVENGDVVRVVTGEGTVEAPALVVPGHADGALTLARGFGPSSRRARAAHGGVDVRLPRLDSEPFWAAASPSRTGRSVPLPVTQLVMSQEGRDVARESPFEGRVSAHERPTLYDDGSRGHNQWGLVVDLAKCTGCSACVVACQSENDTPIVGPEGILAGRAMHWMRIDRYLEGEVRAIAQPMMCQHCEHAPCEYVCPVGATTHSPDGLNEMTYNRCVGTRFCSNNCPYKVRRFNWLDYHDGTSETESLVRNPDVSVRARGVMEKCSYCVQRIRRAEIAARREQREIRDGEVVTACESACPSQAITFGSISDETSRVSAARKDPRVYAVLGELGTRPRTLYAARERDPKSAAGGSK